MNEILIIKDEQINQYVPVHLGGYQTYIKPSDLEKILDDLVDYYDSYTDSQIEEINKSIEQHFFDDVLSLRKKVDKSGYVYIFQCENNFKIGYSKNVSQRVKQLDTRPFPLSCIFKVYHDNAYDLEHKIHERLKNYSVCNEWYTNITAEELKQIIFTTI